MVLWTSYNATWWSLTEKINDEKNKSNTEHKLIHSLDLEYMDLIDVFVTI